MTLVDIHKTIVEETAAGRRCPNCGAVANQIRRRVFVHASLTCESSFGFGLAAMMFLRRIAIPTILTALLIRAACDPFTQRV
jgi:hypothetical protein